MSGLTIHDQFLVRRFANRVEMLRQDHERHKLAVAATAARLDRVEELLGRVADLRGIVR